MRFCRLQPFHLPFIHRGGPPQHTAPNSQHVLFRGQITPQPAVTRGHVRDRLPSSYLWRNIFLPSPEFVPLWAHHRWRDSTPEQQHMWARETAGTGAGQLPPCHGCCTGAPGELPWLRAAGAVRLPASHPCRHQAHAGRCESLLGSPSATEEYPEINIQDVKRAQQVKVLVSCLPEFKNIQNRLEPIPKCFLTTTYIMWHALALVHTMYLKKSQHPLV